MAEGLFNTLRKSKNVVAISAGARAASQIDSNAIEVMREIGIDISEQMPKQLAQEMVDMADRVILMCDSKVCPVIFKETESWGIEDCLDKPIGKVREIRDEIRKKVEKLIKEL